MAEDQTGKIFFYIFNDNLFIDTEPYGPFIKSTYKYWLSVRDTLEADLKKMGINRYYTLVDTFEKFRWCEFLGLNSNNETINDYIEVMVRDGY